MKKYLLIVRCQLLMGWPVTDDDLKKAGLYHEIPFFCDAQNLEDVEIVEEAYELLCAGNHEFRHTEFVELVRVA